MDQENVKKKLVVGEKYLSIKLAGHTYVVAFKNDKKTPNSPDYTGDGVAVWVQKKQPKTSENASNDLVSDEDL